MRSMVVRAETISERNVIVADQSHGQGARHHPVWQGAGVSGKAGQVHKGKALLLLLVQLGTLDPVNNALQRRLTAPIRA